MTLFRKAYVITTNNPLKSYLTALNAFSVGKRKTIIILDSILLQGMCVKFVFFYLL